MALRIADAVRQAMAQAIVDYAGAGALLRIYSGTQPTDANAAATGTLLAELTCGATLGTVSSEGVITFNAITQDSSANGTGTAGYFRIVKSDGTTPVYDGAVSTSGAELNLVSTSITTGQPVQVTAMSLTIGNAT